MLCKTGSPQPHSALLGRRAAIDEPSAESNSPENSAEVLLDEGVSAEANLLATLPSDEEKGGRLSARQQQEKGEANEENRAALRGPQTACGLRPR
ncbi:hypothetical protein FACS1894159_04480 [Bacteroidia bacterium]|nr:hypothetical protein FACS1894159_04480 [Bacteroidia bacterium]